MYAHFDFTSCLDICIGRTQCEKVIHIGTSPSVFNVKFDVTKHVLTSCYPIVIQYCNNNFCWCDVYLTVLLARKNTYNENFLLYDGFKEATASVLSHTPPTRIFTYGLGAALVPSTAGSATSPLHSLTVKWLVLLYVTYQLWLQWRFPSFEVGRKQVKSRLE